MGSVNKLFSKNKSLSLRRFIELCLYKKKLGYYENNRIGTDFTTSPEISQLFGECISVFIASISKNSEYLNLLEFGPGNGTLMKDLIRVLPKLIKSKLNFYLHEKSDYLRTIQKEKLGYTIDGQVNFNKINKLRFKPEPYFFFCNEFFDALPFNQYLRKNNKWFERRIIYKDGKYTDFYQDTKVKIDFDSNPLEGDILEISNLQNIYLKKIFRHIQEFGGAFLIFDYGPFKKEKIDTIQSLRKKKKINFLDYPFESDISYHIDFQNIKKIAIEYDLKTYGPIYQKKFLYYYGINERVEILLEKNNALQKRIIEQFERLTDPNGLGNLIKCLFVSDVSFELKAFEKRNE